MHEMARDFAVDLQSALDARGWTHEQLAGEIPVAVNRVSDWVRRVSRPSRGKGRRACELLELNPEDYEGQFARPGERRSTTPVRIAQRERYSEQTNSAVGASEVETPAQPEQGEDARKMAILDHEMLRYLHALDAEDRPKAAEMIKEYVGRTLAGLPAELVPLETVKTGKTRA